MTALLAILPDVPCLAAGAPVPSPPMDGSAWIAGRYEIGGPLAEGGMGVVYRGVDRVSNRPVAVKRPRSGHAGTAVAARLEAMALRLLRVPGVVQLLDEGEDADGPYLVTEFVDGEPFPGPEVPGTPRGALVAARSAELLEALARVHAAGILHRDLKPRNVLVDREGRVHVLDFGIARGPALDVAAGIDPDAGTPRYLAPEQLGTGAVDARTDLYAVGLMVFEALAGRLPFADASGEPDTWARLWRDPPPLASVAEDVPPAVASLVDRLIVRLPERRPASAAEALAALGRDAPSVRLRMVGRDGPLATLLAAARAGRPIDVRGAPGVGRTRLLREAAAVLATERPVVWVVDGERPLTSLRATFGLGADLAPAELRREVQTRLDAGVVVFVDPPAAVDRWSFALLGELRGAVVGVGGDVVRIGPLTEHDQRDLFRGPDRVLHLREEGARALNERAGGHPGRATAVIAEWLRRGWAHLDDDRVRLDPSALPRLEDPMVGITGRADRRAPIEPGLRALLLRIVLGEGQLDAHALAAAGDVPAWRVGLLLDELADAGLVDVHQGIPRARAGAEAVMADANDAELRHAHRAVASLLPTGSKKRLRHLAQAGAVDDVAHEARNLAATWLAAGRFVEACQVLDVAAASVRRQVPPALEAALLRDYVLAAFSAEDLVHRELAVAAVRRANAATLGIEDVEDLAAAAVALARRHFTVAQGLLEDMPEQGDEGLEQARVAMLVEARTRPHPEEAGEELPRWAAWAQARDARMGRWLGWRGVAAYRTGRFDEAAELQARAVTLRGDGYGRMIGTLNTAIALLETDRPERAGPCARAVIEEAARHRQATFELRGWWVVRSIAYRVGAEGEVDRELVDAALAVGSPGAAAPVLFHEAVVAWRGGDDVLAERLCAAARRAYAGLFLGELLCDGFLLVVRRPRDLEAVETVRQRLTVVPSRRLARQIGALARLGELPEPWMQRLRARRPNPGELRWEILAEREVELIEATNDGGGA